jgi:hypothetical protein
MSLHNPQPNFYKTTQQPRPCRVLIGIVRLDLTITPVNLFELGLGGIGWIANPIGDAIAGAFQFPVIQRGARFTTLNIRSTKAIEVSMWVSHRKYRQIKLWWLHPNSNACGPEFRDLKEKAWDSLVVVSTSPTKTRYYHCQSVVVAVVIFCLYQ